MARGKRKRRTRTDWRVLITQQKRSGLTVAAFCRRKKVSEPSYYWWKRKILDGADERAHQSPLTGRKFIPVRVVESVEKENAPCTAELVVRGGRRIRIHTDAAGLARIVEALEAMASC